jgi:putative salt-induced outer membrane protein
MPISIDLKKMRGIKMHFTKIFLRVLFICIFFNIAIAFLHAEDKKWGDEAELSLIVTGGNTDILTFSLKNKLKYAPKEKILITWELALLYGTSEGKKNAESYFTELRLDYNFTDRFYSFYGLGWLRNTFSGINSRYYLNSGAGYRFLTGPKHYLLGEGGISFTQENYINDSEKSYVGGRLFGLYEFLFTEKNKFSQSILWTVDFSDLNDWILNSETAVISSISDYLSLKAGYTIRYDNEPVETLEKTDTFLLVAMVINI